ncbi:MAG: aromatic ring-hydroxylating dioxygenase subunit alpha [Tildeniella nuda ZEHNDER 1965/U140]|jgi:phenylpropionate dioxygenase-like ring-hydroxylating dioxygenase large terminal subunit|nr:aromatic ring-hydroxylating dioxygenase subunit alpha [Tildeniella nuda ZEHNDER 1965/U140]
MELATTLTSQTVRAGIREVGINPNHWYAVGWAKQLQPGQVTKVTVWQQAIALYRDTAGTPHALADACPHKGVELHRGKVHGQHLACRYHGWEFEPSGQCVHVPYLPPSQKLPCAQARSYPVQEKYGLLWVFPGDPAIAADRQLPLMPEDSQGGWLKVPVTGHFKAHFSICNENSMDVFHGFLHENLQGWFDPLLLSLQETEDAVCAEYQVSYKGRMAKFLGLSERADQATTLPIAVQYRYPHYQSSLRGVSALYLMRLPVSPVESRSFALFFFKVRLPQRLLKLIEPLLQRLLERFVLMRFLAQDIEMMESEQRQYLAEPTRRCVEINPAIIAVQRLIIRQYERFKQSSSPTQMNGHKAPNLAVYRSVESQASLPHERWLPDRADST